MKILLVTHTPPPIVSGTSVVLGRILGRFPPGSYAVLTSSWKGVDRPCDGKLPCEYFTSPVPTPLGPFSTSTALLEWLYVLPAVWHGRKLIRRGKFSAILACPSSGTLLLTAALLAIVCRLDLYVYFLDLFSCGKHFRLRGLFSGPIERLAVRTSRKVFVMSEALSAHYAARYGVEPVLLPHPVELNGSGASVSPPKSRNIPAVIAFTGYIYEYQLDPLQNLAEAVNGMNGVELRIYTSRPKEFLDRMGVCGPNVKYRGFARPSEITRVQKEADILFLPMAFNPPEPLISKTASPGKLPEYLASRTPILVHAPAYAYVSWYAREKGWGLVVDRPNPEALRGSLRALLSDAALRGRLVESARLAALSHEAGEVSRKLRSSMGFPE